MKSRGPRRSLPTTIGGIVAGFDFAIWRRQPPPEELVRKGQPLRAVATDGGEVLVVLPDDERELDAAAHGSDPGEPGTAPTGGTAADRD